MFLFKIFGIFGFMTGPLIAALVGGIGIVKVHDMLKGLLFGGFSGAPADATRAGLFVSTVAGITAITGMGKVSSWARSHLGNEVESIKPNEEK